MDPEQLFERKPEDYPFIYRFLLPYIVQPAGQWEHSFAGQEWRIHIQHVLSPRLTGIVTGIQFDPKSPVQLDGPKELFVGISQIEVHELTLPDLSTTSDLAAQDGHRNLIAALLNDLQYRYLVVSGKYWWNEVSADHFVNMQTESRRFRGLSSSWGGSRRQLPEWRHDDRTLADFARRLQERDRLPVEEMFLTDAKRHYLTGEYHLMHVEAATAIEAVAERAYRSISGVYEQRMFKEGRLAGKVAHLLHTYCGWGDSEIEKVVNAIESRNQVIHDRKRKFSASTSYSQLEVAMRAVRDIMSWVAKREGETPSPRGR